MAGSLQSEPAEADSRARVPEARAVDSPGLASLTARSRPAMLLALQRSAGNRAVQRLLARNGTAAPRPRSPAQPAIRILAREPAGGVAAPLDETSTGGRPDPRDYATFEEYVAAAPAPWSIEYLQGRWDAAGLEGDIVRTVLILGARILRAEADRLGIGIFRGLHARDVASLAAGLGMDPVVGMVPNPPANLDPALNTAEQSFRHLRPVPRKPPLPDWSPYMAGSDRISWTESLEIAAGRGKGWGTNVARLADLPSQYGVVMRGPRQLLADLALWRAHLQSQLPLAPNRRVRERIQWDLGSIERAEAHVVNLLEQETVGHVPNEAVTTHVVERIRLAEYGGYFLAGLSVLISGYNILSAEPDRRVAVTVDEAAAFGAELILPGTGPMASYATQSSRGEFHLMTRIFPHPFMWMIDAYLGETMEENDPAGAARIRRSFGSPLLETQMYMDLFRM
jgi:hypothetical protein